MGELLDAVGEEASEAIGTRRLIERPGRSPKSWATDLPEQVRPLVISLLRGVEIYVSAGDKIPH